MRNERLRAGILFVIACFTSPCCTPLIVPLALVLLAGTPAAVGMGQNLGWIYGVLTLISGISFVLGLRWWNRRKMNQPATIHPSGILVISGDQPHVE